MISTVISSAQFPRRFKTARARPMTYRPPDRSCSHEEVTTAGSNDFRRQVVCLKCKGHLATLWPGTVPVAQMVVLLQKDQNAVRAAIARSSPSSATTEPEPPSPRLDPVQAPREQQRLILRKEEEILALRSQVEDLQDQLQWARRRSKRVQHLIDLLQAEAGDV